MTTLELFRKHRKGEVSRERFLYEVRRDSNLPWVTNTTSYDDAVKILKNKGIIREAQFEPQNITTDPLVDRVNPYALKREVEKLLAKEPELTNDSYKEALNKAAKKLTTPEGVKKAMFANAESVAKADANLQTQPVKKGNHVDKKNGMKKMKGQQMPKATTASTKENKKTKKPKGVEIMPDKGVEGSEKVIKESLISELTAYLKKKLNLAENSPYHNFYEGMVIQIEEGIEGIVKEINGGTLCIVLPDGSEMDMQMNRAQQLIDKSKELPQSVQDMGAKQEYESGFNQIKEVSEDNLYQIISDIKSNLGTSSALEIELRQNTLQELENVEMFIEEENWEEALMSLEDIAVSINTANPREYGEVYAEDLNNLINQVEGLYSEMDSYDWDAYEDDEIEERLYKDKKSSTVVSVKDPTRDPLATDPEFRTKFEPLA